MIRNNCLKYRELEQNEVSGSVVYSTKTHLNIISADCDITVTADNNVGMYSYRQVYVLEQK